MTLDTGRMDIALDAALHLAASKPWDEISLAEIARESNKTLSISMVKLTRTVWLMNWINVWTRHVRLSLWILKIRCESGSLKPPCFGLKPWKCIVMPFYLSATAGHMTPFEG